MSLKKLCIIGLGEILWDVLPTEKHLGGAPANFAFVSNQLGNHGLILSRVGNDKLGKEIIETLITKQISTDFIQSDYEKPTGKVNVALKNGQPIYEIIENAAWDFLELSENWREIAEKCDAVCFGSLAQRREISRQTIREFIGLTKGWRIFDVNLRQKYFSEEILRESFRLANIVKLNHEELPIASEMFDCKDENQIETARNLLEKFDLRMICITRGGNGSLLITKDESSEHKGLNVKIADTIGAGDAFTAALTNGILRNWDLGKINDFANKVGAFVASNTGAMPDFSRFELL